MKSPVEMNKAEPKRALPPFAVRGHKNGQPFDVRLPTQEEAERVAAEFKDQGAEDITISKVD